jgi:hypothetical protein
VPNRVIVVARTTFSGTAARLWSLEVAPVASVLIMKSHNTAARSGQTRSAPHQLRLGRAGELDRGVGELLPLTFAEVALDNAAPSASTSPMCASRTSGWRPKQGRSLPQRTSNGCPVRRSTECRSPGEQKPRHADRALRTRPLWNGSGHVAATPPGAPMRVLLSWRRRHSARAPCLLPLRPVGGRTCIGRGMCNNMRRYLGGDCCRRMRPSARILCRSACKAVVSRPRTRRQVLLL